ncbi:hypothetical protein [Asanoa sp. NPDC050611]|uniref:hypothetical protein n=1 Tax=Asanoa sp. NPDC050611 TaxID=3157098 RepID=UPI0033E235E0
MLNILASNAGGASPTFRPVSRAPGESNLDWLGRELAGPAVDGTHLLLVGGRDHIGFRLRVAQAHLRHDLSPSHWSHAALLGPGTPEVGATATYEVSLDPPRGFGVPTAANALQVGRLDAYADPGRFPNIALLRLPVPAVEWQRPSTAEQISVLERFRKQRSVLDVTELVLQWLAFLWGVGRAANPLLDGYGVPSAAMIEVVLNAVGYDVTPALESRASCPEAIWQAAKWWHPYYSERTPSPITGAWHVSDRIGTWSDSD